MRAPRGISRTALLPSTLLLLILALADRSEAADEGCSYTQLVQGNTTYYVYNPDYPSYYSGRHNCRWETRSNSSYRIRLTCNTFDLPPSNNCNADALLVTVNSTTSQRYCGNGTFTVESEGNELNITLTTPYWSRGGKFLCELHLIEPILDTDNCRCGWKNPTRIVGGTNAGVNEYPMMAGLVDFAARRIYCGGTIISERHVLTAAHCLVILPAEQLGVVVGEHDVSTGSDTNATRLFRTLYYVIHPEYTNTQNGYDIAIIKVDGVMSYSNEVGPACLPFWHRPDSFGGAYVDLLGWGTTSFAGARSNVLQKVTVNVNPLHRCRRFYPRATYSQICTRGEDKDACQFDSGGPVLWQNPTTRRVVLIGIISYGGYCDSNGGVNTRVGAYIDWIASMTADARYCATE